MSYLRKFWTSLQITFLKLDRISRKVSRGERISRFILSDKFMPKGRVSAAAFLPSPKTKDTSVYRTRNCNERRIWLLGDVFVARIRKLDVLARADLKSDLVFDNGLSIVAHPSPHPRHAVVTKWPDEKSLQRIKALAWIIHEGEPFFSSPGVYAWVHGSKR